MVPVTPSSGLSPPRANKQTRINERNKTEGKTIPGTFRTFASSPTPPNSTFVQHWTPSKKQQYLPRGGISYSCFWEKGASYTNFGITAPEFLTPLEKSQPAFLSTQPFLDLVFIVGTLSCIPVVVSLDVTILVGTILVGWEKKSPAIGRKGSTT